MSQRFFLSSRSSFSRIAWKTQVWRLISELNASFRARFHSSNPPSFGMSITTRGRSFFFSFSGMNHSLAGLTSEVNKDSMSDMVDMKEKKVKLNKSNLTGQRFGRYLVIEQAPSRRYRSATRACWLCRCDCGKEQVVDATSLRLSKALSCGCDRAEKHPITHGDSRRGNTTPEYIVWTQMRQRCVNSKAPNWKNYGGRGITICERWSSYENFLADMGRRPTPHHSLDRRDNDGPYAPENCRWATYQEQVNNQRRTVLIAFNGRIQPAADWGRELNLSASVITARVKLGWEPERIFSTPVRTRRKGGKSNLSTKSIHSQR